MRKPKRPPAWYKVFQTLSPDELHAMFSTDLHEDDEASQRYLHWDEIRRRTPPEGWSHEKWWARIKFQRMAVRREMPLRDTGGRPFFVGTNDTILESLSRLDQQSAGRVALDEQVVNGETRNRYIVNSLIEEATTSSLLEGAATTREEAREMIRAGRPAKTKGERMVLNNYLTMEHITAIKDEELTPSIVMDLHRRMTERTWDDNEDASGRFRTESERIAVRSDDDDELLHLPPTASELPQRMQAMCEFANGRTPSGFLHPVVRAILLHFWLAYDHPFKDGNGRTARALFYWSMLHQGYWLFEFLPISSRFLQAPAQYGRAFLYTETDDNDMTYFLVYNLRVIERSLRLLEEYLRRKTHEVQQVERRLRSSHEFNHRQLALLSHALRHPHARYTLESHGRSHGVSRQTARNDLRALVIAGLLAERRVNRRLIFQPVVDMANRLGDTP